jgi:hypothetical protein
MTRGGENIPERGTSPAGRSMPHVKTIVLGEQRSSVSQDIVRELRNQIINKN